MTAAPEPVERVTRYEVSCVPEDHDDADLFTVTVQYRGNGRWAVQRGEHRFLGADGTWSTTFGWNREPVTDEEIAAFEAGYQAWLDAHRFDEETARRLAREAAPKLTIRGYTVADVLAEYAKERGK